MSDTAGKSHTPPSTYTPPPKRRNIRKGTRSCWECKRRKARCTFENASDTVCISCSRRGSTCVSQEYPEETSQARQSSERRREHFAKIGKMVVQIVREEAMAEPSPGVVDDWKPESESEPGAERLDGELETPDRVRHAAAHITAQKSISTLPPHSGLDVPATKPINDSWQPAKVTSPGALPTPRDVAGVSQSMGRTSGYFMNIMILPYSQLQLYNFRMEVPDLHAPEVHPILKAKKMLMLATNIQSLQPKSQRLSCKLSAPPATLVQQLMKAAAYVGTRTCPAVFVEELECLILEAVLLANGGHLQHSWLVFRRLVADAQLMGLHRRQHSVKALDSHNNLDTRFFWFRILYTERLLCLLLGLPQASTDCTMGDEAALLVEEHPVGRLERMHCVIASKLLQRNDMETTYDQETRNIDQQIQRAAQSMPPRWWLMPNLAGISDDAQGFAETIRLTNQLFHHFLIIQLHLPYMLRPTASSKQRDSMTTCVNSSREVMVRFISFRSIQSVTFYCRAIDFFALIASMTLLLAHIDSHKNNEGESLTHQRPSDRALIEQAMEYMDDFNKSSQDILSKRSADVIRNLLEVENQAFSKHGPTGETKRDTHNTHSMDGHRLQLNIPNIGTVHISCDIIARHDGSPEGPSDDTLRTSSKEDSTNLVMLSEFIAPEEPMAQIAEPHEVKNQHEAADPTNGFAEAFHPICEEGMELWLYGPDNLFQGIDLPHFDLA
ncbi:Zn(2)-C6 fungal-type domain-containing protein [Fusarium falciforme]|uniref:Zn(2)-C6 fungal-type domain-containing protein n=1 Tax=Fusarium falciforme TaxID=195108 RepID=UPI002301F9E6|nr:Zn(2)-C6 fungal-type domain-containing protein [Fusarium falciforme]WAO91343.1 Zn(2)-C6 fungal-type domain-containing protein [Fusarium falciforme]